MIYENDLFVFVTQVKQVYYVEDPRENWHVVTNTHLEICSIYIYIYIYGDLENNDMENHFGIHLFDKSIVTKDENVNWF
jgi:hypothetical protein